VRIDRRLDRREGLLIVTGKVEKGRWCFGTMFGVSDFVLYERGVIFVLSGPAHKYSVC